MQRGTCIDRQTRPITTLTGVKDLVGKATLCKTVWVINTNNNYSMHFIIYDWDSFELAFFVWQVWTCAVSPFFTRALACSLGINVIIFSVYISIVCWLNCSYGQKAFILHVQTKSYNRNMKYLKRSQLSISRAFLNKFKLEIFSKKKKHKC